MLCFHTKKMHSPSDKLPLGYSDSIKENAAHAVGSVWTPPSTGQRQVLPGQFFPRTAQSSLWGKCLIESCRVTFARRSASCLFFPLPWSTPFRGPLWPPLAAPLHVVSNPQGQEDLPNQSSPSSPDSFHSFWATLFSRYILLGTDPSTLVLASKPEQCPSGSCL